MNDNIFRKRMDILMEMDKTLKQLEANDKIRLKYIKKAFEDISTEIDNILQEVQHEHDGKA